MSSFGYQRQLQVMLNNSAILIATPLYSYDGQTLIPKDNISSVSFTILKPTDDPTVPSIRDQGGAITGDGTGQFVVTNDLNDVPGEYKALATFLYSDNGSSGLVKSIPVDYTVVDPFVRAGASPADGAVRQAWLKIEDCFDSEQGGPWLRDMTLAVFDQSKIRGLIPEVLLDINNQMPYTSYTESSFPYANMDGEALMAQGLLVSAIRHLMRSYTEQPDVTSSPVAFMDRKSYQQRWKAVYDVESAKWDKWLNRWKLQSYDLSSSAMLLGTKAGRMLPAPMRSRNVGRGF